MVLPNLNIKICAFTITLFQIAQQPHIDPTHFIRTLPESRFPPNEQQDSTEFVRYMFDMLGGEQQALIRNSFSGELSEVMRCTECGHETRKPETFASMIVFVPTEEEAAENYNYAGNSDL